MRKRFIVLGLTGLVGASVAVGRKYIMSAEDARAELARANFGAVVPMRAAIVQGGLRYVASVMTERHAVELVRINGEWFPLSCTALATDEELALDETKRNTRITSRIQLESLMPAYSEPLR
jgi:hypothetical protein